MTLQTVKSGESRTLRTLATIENRSNKAVVKCLGSDPARAHGLAPILVICDEMAQWEGTKVDKMFSALRTAMGKIPG